MCKYAPVKTPVSQNHSAAALLTPSASVHAHFHPRSMIGDRTTPPPLDQKHQSLLITCCNKHRLLHCYHCYTDIDTLIIITLLDSIDNIERGYLPWIEGCWVLKRSQKVKLKFYAFFFFIQWVPWLSPPVDQYFCAVNCCQEVDFGLSLSLHKIPHHNARHVGQDGIAIIIFQKRCPRLCLINPSTLGGVTDELFSRYICLFLPSMRSRLARMARIKTAAPINKVKNRVANS